MLSSREARLEICLATVVRVYVSTVRDSLKRNAQRWGIRGN